MKNRLAATRLYRGLTIPDLAKQLHVEEALLEAWESGQVDPTPDQLIQLANLLSVPLDFLLCLDHLFPHA